MLFTQWEQSGTRSPSSSGTSPRRDTAALTRHRYENADYVIRNIVFSNVRDADAGANQVFD